MDPAAVHRELREHALAKEGAVEDHPWGDVAWKVKGKMFAVSSENSAKVSVKSTLEKQAALVTHPHIEASHYVGRYGWVTIDCQDRDTLDLAKELMDESYAAIAAKPKRKNNVVTK